MSTTAMGPPVVLAIAAAAAAAMTGPLDDVVVLDAMDAAQAYQQRSLTVGGGWDEEYESISTADAVRVVTDERGGGRRVVETTAVSCVAYAGGGETDLPGYRAQVGEILAALSAALRRLTTVDGASARARLGDQSWLQLRTVDGDGVLVSFDVLVTVLP